MENEIDAAQTGVVMAERHRIENILYSDAARGRETLVRHLAFRSNLDTAQAIAALDASHRFCEPLRMQSDLAARLIGRPIALDAAYANSFARQIEHGALDHDDDRSAGVVGDGLGRTYDKTRIPAFDSIDGVAVIAIEGMLMHKGAFIGRRWGMTSYEGLQSQIVRAAADPSVRGVVFEIDSPGGEVSGLFDTAEMLSNISESKPTLAVLTDSALSAAYALASGARQIVMPRHGRTGSIGAVALHQDITSAMERSGVKVSVLRAGKRKAEANSFEPLADEARSAIVRDLEAVRQSFADLVGRNRGSRFSATRALATKARIFDGEEAVELGLADAVAHSSDAFAEFLRALRI